MGFEYYKKLWHSHGITGIRISTMAEGIEAVINVQKSKSQYLYFVDIVADDINYLPELAILESVIEDAPILIATSKYDEDEHHAALDNGAYFYGEYCEEHQKNLTAVTVVVNRYHRVKSHHADTNTFTSNGIIISLSQRKAFVNSEEINLTKIEFDMLFYLMSNRGTALSYDDIYTNVWHYPFNDSSINAIKVMITKLRSKITGDENEENIIENLRGFGYIMR